ncbi:MAG: hypothetical protein HPY80_10305 [Bacteroidales bacterium]|jgi:hypothetical protein|nr:hypothetical protein [Bacteroidales bacterium]NPV37045.1 hypothetical protein [Bacteroidales bacterium]
MNRGGFSWNRFLGISRVKYNISRKTGIPLSRSGRQQKIGRLVTGGCLPMMLFWLTLPAILLLLVVFS